MEQRKKLIHVTAMPIRWGDMDAYGHVNSTVYFRYMEQARVEWIEAMRFPVRPGGEGPVIVNASCTFLVPMTYPGTVDVRTYVGHPGRSSFQTYVEMSVAGTLCAEGSGQGRLDGHAERPFGPAAGRSAGGARNGVRLG